MEAVIERVYRSILDKEAAFTAIDGGAHTGFHTFRLASIPSCQQVVAIEPNEKILQKFAVNFAASPHAAKVDLVKAALQDDQAAEFVTFKRSTSHPGRSGIDPFWVDVPGVVYEPDFRVAATTIDRLASQAHWPIRFIKLDLEGGEFAALKGGASTLMNARPVVVFENGKRSLARMNLVPDDFLAFMKGAGYEVIGFHGKTLDASNLYDFWYAWGIPAGSSSSFKETLSHIMSAE